MPTGFPSTSPAITPSVTGLASDSARPPPPTRTPVLAGAKGGMIPNATLLLPTLLLGAARRGERAW
jgi:hypothetical protein